MPRSSSCLASTGVGALVIGSMPRLGLREGDDLADVLLAGEDRHQPVDAEREAAVRRGAVLERVEEEAEPLLRLLVADAEQAEDARLQLGLVDPDRPGAELPPVEHQVVGLAAHLQRVGLQQVHDRRDAAGVNGWWPGFGRPVTSSTPTNSGKSTTHR